MPVLYFFLIPNCGFTAKSEFVLLNFKSHCN
jgi:hypothetical protein